MAAKKPKAKVWTASDVVASIRQRFRDAQRYAVFEQVNHGTGAIRGSWVDVVVVNLWPSDGLCRKAIEVKVSRADFMGEIQRPAKNAWARDMFHEFWYCAPRGVVNSADEIPVGCGWMIPTSAGCKVVKAAQRNDSPENDELLVMALARASVKESDARIKVAVTAAIAHARENDYNVREAFACREAVEQFLNERVGNAFLTDKAERTLEDLRKATLDAKDKRDRQQLESVLNNFQTRMQGAFREFCRVAEVGLLECDDTGKFIRGYYDAELEDDLYSRHEKRMNADLVKTRERIKAIASEGG